MIRWCICVCVRACNARFNLRNLAIHATGIRGSRLARNPRGRWKKKKRKNPVQSIIERADDAAWKFANGRWTRYREAIWNIAGKLSCALSGHLMISGDSMFPAMCNDIPTRFSNFIKKNLVPGKLYVINFLIFSLSLSLPVSLWCAGYKSKIKEMQRNIPWKKEQRGMFHGLSLALYRFRDLIFHVWIMQNRV